MVNFWQFLNSSSEKRAHYIGASCLSCLGILAFLLHVLDPLRIQWSILELTTACVHACVSYYLHHHAQKFMDASQVLQTEIYASGFLAVLLAPFAWLEFNTIQLENVNASFASVRIVFLCVLFLLYRRADLFFMTLTQPETAKFLIATTFLSIIASRFELITPLFASSIILLAVSAYYSSLDPPQPNGSNESRSKLYILLAFCALLLLFQCSLVVVANAKQTVSPVSLTPMTRVKSLQPIQLDPEYELNRLICLRKVRERVLHEVGSRIKDGEPLAYMDWPMHWNLGDILIWQGTQAVLETRGQFPIVTDDIADRNITRANQVFEIKSTINQADLFIAKLLRNGAALLHGGGNFGDLWPDNANFRLDAVNGLKDNELIFLPQSIHYRKEEVMKTHNTTFQKHDKTLFMLRDYPSLNYSRVNFTGKPAMYVPDMAFAMGPQTPSANPIVDVIFLLRLDKERVVKLDQRKFAYEKLAKAKVSYEVWDFPIFGFPLKLAPDNKTAVYDYTKVYPKQLNKVPHNTRHAYLGFRTQMANNLFSRGRLVITDRLHASIMSTLMGKPVIYLDNSYKKITNVRGALAQEFYECTDENLHARHVSTLTEAADLALNILNGSVKI